MLKFQIGIFLHITIVLINRDFPRATASNQI